MRRKHTLSFGHLMTEKVRNVLGNIVVCRMAASRARARVRAPQFATHLSPLNTTSLRWQRGYEETHHSQSTSIHCRRSLWW